ncbi:MAG: carboxypeptidase-like regulatory domain-containing protein [Thermoplasmatota archaeon]
MMKNKKITFFLLFLLFFSFCLLNSSPLQNVDASEENKQMAIDTISSVGSQQNFTVSVYEINATNETPSPYLVGVTIVFNNHTYSIPVTDEDGEISITAPSVTENTTFLLIAQKQGYQNATASIMITPFSPSTSKQLYINTEQFTVEAEKQFTVTVYDETGTPISGATVGIQNHIEKGFVSITNPQGQASLQAPNEDTITLIAQKQGYKDATETIWVNTKPGLINELFNHPYTVIIIAGIVLIFAIIYITFFNKNKTTPLSPPAQKKPSKIPLSSSPPSKNNRSRPRSMGTSSKVEEIRITRKEPEKKIVPIKHKPAREIPPMDKRKNTTDTWYKGNHNLGYTIDKITKKTDETKKDKWFAGTTDIQKKIDETLKKKQDEKDDE